MVFTRKLNSALPAKDLYIGNTQTLVKNHYHKYLGIDLSSDLSWAHHVQLLNCHAKAIQVFNTTSPGVCMYCMGFALTERHP